MSKETIYKIVSAVCACALAIAGAILLESCSTTKATIMSARDAAQTTITITTQNPVSADTKVDPSVVVQPLK